MDNETALALLMFVAGWNWGEWWTARKAKKRLSSDTGLKLLADMAWSIAEKRKMVGRGMTISSTQKFKTPHESYTLTLEAAGDVTALDPETLP